MSTGGVPIDVVLKKPHPARPELVVLCDVSGSVAGFSHFTLLLVHALRQQFSARARLRLHRHHRRGHRAVRADADLAVAVQRITREAGVYTRDGHSDYGHAFVSFLEKCPNVLSPRSSLLVLGDGRNNYRNPEVDLLTHMVDGEPARALAQPRAQAPVGQRRLGGAALHRTSSPCTSAGRPSSSPR